MNQEKAILHLNKFKNLRNARVKDTANGLIYLVHKARMEKVNDHEYIVWISVVNEMSAKEQEIQSDYAQTFFKEL